MKFILLVLFVGDTGLQPIYADRFDTLDACEAKRTEVVKQIPRQQPVDFASFCAPIRNSTESSV